jgi:hypothetical protein
MGAQLLTRTYDKTNRENLKELIHSDQDQDRCEDGCSYSGSWGVKDSNLNFVSKKFSNEQECEDYIANNNDKWGGT